MCLQLDFLSTNEMFRQTMNALLRQVPRTRATSALPTRAMAVRWYSQPPPPPTTVVEEEEPPSLFRQRVDRIIAEGAISVITQEDALKRKDEFTFIDVREEYEWLKLGVLDVPTLRTIERGLVERFVCANYKDLKEPLVFYCAGALRSALTVESVQNLGYTNVHSLDGGFDEWPFDTQPMIRSQHHGHIEHRDEYMPGSDTYNNPPE
eukprot:m.16070 g.16070  ORF g.16070 m.16070 type:complete len:207 (+) comp6911_c0_seq1:427-1047(+)